MKNLKFLVIDNCFYFKTEFFELLKDITNDDDYNLEIINKSDFKTGNETGFNMIFIGGKYAHTNPATLEILKNVDLPLICVTSTELFPESFNYKINFSYTRGEKAWQYLKEEVLKVS